MRSLYIKQEKKILKGFVSWERMDYKNKLKCVSSAWNKWKYTHLHIYTIYGTIVSKALIAFIFRLILSNIF